MKDKKLTNDDTRDIAIRCVDNMFEKNLELDLSFIITFAEPL